MALVNSNSINYPFNSQSKRLIFRPLVESDWNDWLEFMSDDEAIRYFPAFTSEKAEENARNWIHKQLDRYQSGNFGMHALVETETNDFVGQCGLLTQEVDGKIELEIGYSLLRKHWGKGYASEAAQFLMEWAFENQISDSIISIIKTDNLSSRKVAERIGMKPSAEVIWKDLDVVIYRINNPNSDL